MDPRVVDAMAPGLREHFGNAASRSHAWAGKPKKPLSKHVATWLRWWVQTREKSLDQRCHRVHQPRPQRRGAFYQGKGRRT